ncbi:uncharacterized protein [Clytia hemisphaerica]|uniref:uncharacterized protein n=1 Tax=Clytia hemisphaerica TaxID=252671 RepID=UPI0034D4EA48
MVEVDTRYDGIKKLYGPGRILDQAKCKILCTKDVVRDALGRGKCDAALEPSNWITSTKFFHKGDTTGFERAKIADPKVNRKSSLKLGFHKPRYRCTTTEEFIWHKNAEIPERVVPDNSVNIPEFCPNLAVEKTVKDSIYTSSFSVDPSVPRPKPKPYEERKKYTNDLRETHFKLGSWDEANFTETQHSLGFEKRYNEEGLSNGSNRVVASNRHLSKVFRQGDYNRLDRKSINKTITKRDFPTPPVRDRRDLKFIHEFTEPSYHHSSHFDLGSASSADPKKLSSSLYHKDFATKALVPSYDRDRLLKEATSGTHHLELFRKESNPRLFTTTKESNFKDYGTQNVLQLKQERFKCCSEFKDRIGKDQHQIYHDQLNAGRNELPNQRMLSMTSSNFHRPPLVHNKYDFEIPTNNHLSGNFDCMRSAISEAHEKYTPHQSSSLKTRQECHDRRRDNKSTHFSLWNGPLDRKITEQESQFRDRPPLDPSVPPAGKYQPVGHKYQHIFSTSKPTIQNIPQSSFMMDFKNPSSYKTPYDAISKSRSCRWEEPLASYLFHTGDGQSKDIQKTTTERHFISPIEQLMKQKRFLGSRTL